jgi:hypothetical protein
MVGKLVDLTVDKMRKMLAYLLVALSEHGLEPLTAAMKVLHMGYKMECSSVH